MPVYKIKATLAFDEDIEADSFEEAYDMFYNNLSSYFSKCLDWYDDCDEVNEAEAERQRKEDEEDEDEE